jgi:hypothetical protein
MKKIIIFIFSSFFMYSLASAEVGVNIGISGSMGAFSATGTETESDEKNKEDAVGAAAWGSLFIEKTIGDRLAIGIDYVPSALESETSEVARRDKTTTDTQTVRTNKIQVDFTDLTTLYLSLNLTDSLYIKAGAMQVDVETNETLGTGSEYGNTSLDGTIIGVGYNTNFDNGFFARLEGNYMDFDGASLTSSTNSDNKISIDDLQGVSAKLSLGKSF